MPIIKSVKAKKLEKIKFEIDFNLYSEIKEYCKWASVDSDDIGMFFEQAAEFILKKDADWKKYVKGKYGSKSQTTLMGVLAELAGCY
ncbi:MAG: hypothetical protein ACD_69C00365G0002 [uncultured bacterium]|nr:MAG: hypothetical protein ACD_69C00365G0002 [uncultured bacterium]